METARGSIGAVSELSTRMKLGEDDFHARKANSGDLVYGNTTTVIRDRSRMVRMQAHIDRVAVAFQGLVDRIINNLPEAVHESTVVGRSDVHAGALTNGLESFENR